MPVADDRVASAVAALGISEATVNGIRMRIFSKGPQNLVDWYVDAARNFGSHTCLVDGTDSLSYDETMLRARVFAEGLRSSFGVRAGERVAIIGRNSLEWMLAFIGSTWVGAIAVAMNALWQQQELLYGLKNSGSVVVVADGPRLERLGHPSDLDVLRGVVVVGPGTCSLAVPLKRWSELVPPGPVSEPDPLASPGADAAAIIMYTSGSTGKPKGVVLTHRNAASNLAYSRVRALAIQGSGAAVPGTLINVPLFHVMGMFTGWLQGFGVGRKHVILERWNADEACRLIEKHALTQFIGVPTQSLDLVSCEEFKTRDMSKLVSIGGGGAPPIAKMLTDIAASGRTAWNGFGLTETSGGIISIGGEDLRLRPRSCGKPIPVMDVAIVSDTGEELPPGVPGELVARGPYIFKEYWNDAKATADAFFPGGWFRTGDLASRDEDGFITILDRIKDVIVRGGENISCPEVEDAVYRHPSVAEAVVFGVPHPRLGEEVAVVVTLKNGARTLGRAELTDMMSSQLAKFKVPSRVFLWPGTTLPRGGTGKTPKREIKKAILDKSTPGVRELAEPSSRL